MASDTNLPSDSHRPKWGDTSDRKFFTKKGWLTPYSLACGYIEVRGDDESGARLAAETGGGYRVVPTGRWTRSPGRHYPTLSEARVAFTRLDHREINTKHQARAQQQHQQEPQA